MNNKIFGLISGCLLLGSLVFSQENDFKNWNAVSLDIKLVKNLDFRLEQELRFENNASFLGDYISVAGFSYKLSKQIKVRGLYRFTVNRSTKNPYENNHRFYADLILKQNFQRFDVSYRFRYQIKFLPDNDKDFTYFNPQHLRHQFQLKYDIPKFKLEPNIAIEWYQALNNPIKNTIETLRYTAGLEYPLTKSVAAELFYRIEKENDMIHKAKNNYILGINLSINL
jgi:opacity protein-like surface antigen